MRRIKVRAVFAGCVWALGWIPYPLAGQSAALSDFLKVHLDMRTSVLDRKVTKMWGGSLGWAHETGELTLGYYWMGGRGRRQMERVLAERNKNNMSQYAVPEVSFLGVGYWYNVFDSRRWKAGVPLEAGIGKARMRNAGPLGITTGEAMRKEAIFPLQLAGYGEWKATRWLGAGLQLGYRHYLASSRAELPPINGIFYRARVLVYLEAFYDWRNYLFRGAPLSSPFY